MIRLPNFFIVGAAKSGTTSLYHYLKQHPEIYMSPVKEPKFFTAPVVRFPHNGPGDVEIDKRVIRTRSGYLELFAGVSGEKCLGEASADYLYFHEHVARSIKLANPRAKIIIVLRNPVERAFSAYSHLKKDGRETLTFENALEAEPQRKRNNYEFIWLYKDVGFYYSQVKTYFEIFGKESVRIYLYDDFAKDPVTLAKDICKFLDVDTDFIPDISARHNTSKKPGNKAVHDFLLNYDHPLKKALRPLFLNTIGKDNTELLIKYLKKKNFKRESMKSEVRQYLISLYRDDILSLQDLIRRDLSNWLE